jgi:hypothetical protein
MTTEKWTRPKALSFGEIWMALPRRCFIGRILAAHAWPRCPPRPYVNERDDIGCSTGFLGKWSFLQDWAKHGHPPFLENFRI